MRKNKIVSVCFIVAFAMVLISGIPMATLGDSREGGGSGGLDTNVDCGSLYISGPPPNPWDPPSWTVTATAIDNSVDIGDTCLVTFYVSYTMEEITGAADHAYVSMSVSGGGSDEADAGDYGTGILTVSKSCSPGDTVDVTMTATYKDNIGWPNEYTIGSANDISTNTMLIPENHAPNKPSTPSGNGQGEAGVTYTYTSSTTDPDGDTVSYYWDWGDGDHTGWTTYYISGATCSAYHSWDEEGEYSIRVKSKDDPKWGESLESPWSDPKDVSMPANSPYNTTQISTSMVIIPETTMVDLVTGELITIPARTGYFVNLDLDEIYDIVHFDVTREQCPVYLDAEGNYVIDIEPDGVHEATIDPEDITPASNPI